MAERWLTVTIDTEVDKDDRWHVSRPVSFDSVCRAVPEVLSPLFDEFGVVPTYLLSAEVIEDQASAEVLASLGERAELGTHLHAEFVTPGRVLAQETMAGRAADTVQCEYPSAIEAAKLATLTDLFAATFGYRPKSFRAGRYGMSDTTLATLAKLGYRVDSSVTPGLRWRYPQATLDYRRWTPKPRWFEMDTGRILELPVSIRPMSRIAPIAERAPRLMARAARACLGDRARYQWLRPSWGHGNRLIEYAEATDERVLVMMLHNIEVTPGASPYAATDADVTGILDAMRELFAYWRATGFQFCGLAAAADLV